MIEKKNTNKRLLTNVAMVRPILILLLVFYHAFAIYSGAWAPIEGYPEIRAYWWLDKLSFAFLLEMFVFISGYVFGYQVRTIGERKLEAKSFFCSKTKRLIVPCILFSILYFLIFGDIRQPISTSLYEVISGVGHLWFLPMLFWCFAGVWLIEKLRIKEQIALPLLLFLSLCSFVPLPIQMNLAMYYMLFFYVGYILQKKDVELEHFYKPSYVVVLSVLFLILFPVLTIYVSNSEKVIQTGGGYFTDSIMIRILRYASLNLSRLIYSSVGLATFLLAIGCVEKKRSRDLNQLIVSFGEMSMGIYLLQQFILKVIYNFSELPYLLGANWLPWFGFVVTLIVSTILVYLMRLTKFGRYLIG